MNPTFSVLKFGGSSVAEPSHWQTIYQQLLNEVELGHQPVLVLSALKNVSNLLEALLHQAINGVHPTAIEHIREMHEGFAAQIGVNNSQLLKPFFDQLHSCCEKIHQSKTISPKHHALVLATGELLSTTIGNAYLQQQGMNSAFFDVRQLLVSETKKQNDPWHHYTSNQCNYQPSSKAQQKLERLASVIVTQGFIASDAEGDTVLLGREGSDTSATYLASILQAKKAEIWTDVPGVFSFNPRVIKNALQLVHLNFEQAETLARYGAKVLHPRALAPVKRSSIPVRVKSTKQPEHPGTKISSAPVACHGVLAMACENDVLVVENNSDSPLDLSELLNSGFDLLGDRESTVDLLIYANSDTEKPSLSSVTEKICSTNPHSSDLLNIQEHYSVITVIGSEEDLAWQDKIISFCQEQSYQPKMFQHPHRLTFLVKKSDASFWYKALHKNFIEPYHNEGCFGLSWCHYIY